MQLDTKNRRERGRHKLRGSSMGVSNSPLERTDCATGFCFIMGQENDPGGVQSRIFGQSLPSRLKLNAAATGLAMVRDDNRDDDDPVSAWPIQPT